MAEVKLAARAQAWKTRRERYGPADHNGSYCRTPGSCLHCERMTTLLIDLYRTGEVSEGQVARATGLHRIEIRRRADEDEPAALVRGRSVLAEEKKP